MDDPQPIAFMPDDDVLAAFGAAYGTAGEHVDPATYARVMAHELVRARNRVNLYRTLYASFLEAGRPFLVENLDEAPGGGVPAKLAFSDDPAHVAGLEAAGDVNVWTEPELLAALAHERAVQEYFTGLLQELEPAV